VHHIVPQEENGPDSEDNAAPLCPSCHETYGANPQKRRFIREARDFWYDICANRFSSDPDRLDKLAAQIEALPSRQELADVATKLQEIVETTLKTTSTSTAGTSDAVLRRRLELVETAGSVASNIAEAAYARRPHGSPVTLQALAHSLGRAEAMIQVSSLVLPTMIELDRLHPTLSVKELLGIFVDLLRSGKLTGDPPLSGKKSAE
jgi:hypothetical protein